MFKRTAVFGGAGFVGTNLVHRLIDMGRYVYSFDNLSGLGNLLNIADLMQQSGHFFARCDAGNKEEVKQALLLAAVDDIFVCIPSKYQSMETSEKMFRNLFEGLLEWKNSLNGSKEQRIIVLLSDRYENLGFNDRVHAKQMEIINEYIGKGLPLISLYVPRNFGPFQQPDSPLPLMIYRAIEGESIPVVNSEDSVGEFVYVSDVIDALLLVEKSGEVGKCYELPGEKSDLTNIELADMVCEILNEKTPPPMGRYQALIEEYKAQDNLNENNPKDGRLFEGIGTLKRTDISEAVRKTVEWYLSNEHWYNQSKLRYFDLWHNPKTILHTVD